LWTKLDDNLLDHHKLLAAGERLGPNGPALALGLYVIGLLWANRQLTDGHLPREVVKRFSHLAKPLEIATELVRAGLWEKHGDGYQIHDFAEYNFAARDVKARRAREKERKRRERSSA